MATCPNCNRKLPDTQKGRYQPPNLRRFESDAMVNPNIALVESEHPVYANDSGEVITNALAGLLSAGFAALLGWGLVTILDQQISVPVAAAAAGLVGLLVFLWRQWVADENRTGYHLAKFHEPKPEQEESVLIKDPTTPPTQQRYYRNWVNTKQLMEFANLLPGYNWVMTYDAWTGSGRTFSRSQFKRLRETLARIGYIEIDQDRQQVTGWTDMGRGAVMRWQSAKFETDILDRIKEIARGQNG